MSSSSSQVLIVSPSRVAHSVLEDTFEDKGYSLIAAESGGDALEQMDEHGASVDLIILDDYLKDLTVFEVLDARSKGNLAPQAKIMAFVQDYINQDEIDKLLNLGVNAVVQKSSESQEILFKVDGLLKGELTSSSSDEGVRLPVHLGYQAPNELDDNASYIRSLSADSVFIQTKKPLNIGEVFEFELALSETDHLPLKGVVTWKKDYLGQQSENELYGMGVNLMFANADQRLRLEQHIKGLARKKRILVVDDDPLVLEIIKDTLEQENYSVFTLKNGVDALFMTKESKPDLILMDVEMPDFKGPKLCSILKTCTDKRDVRIILHSSKTAEELSQLASECQADGFITKTNNWGDLVQSVSRFLA